MNKKKFFFNRYKFYLKYLSSHEYILIDLIKNNNNNNIYFIILVFISCIMNINFHNYQSLNYNL